MTNPGINIPLAIGAYSRAAGFEPRAILKNMYIEADKSGAANDDIMRIQRPGCALYQNVHTGTSVRGLTYQQGILGSLPVAAIGTGLYKFDGTTPTSLGTIVDDGNMVQMASTNFGLAVLSGSTLYFYSTADSTLHTVAIPNSDVPVTIDTINSYVLVGCQSGVWYWLVPGELIIDALHFATAESMPDELVAMLQLHDEVFFFGTQSTEVWQPTGDPDLIMARASGRTWDRGLMARDCLRRIDNSAMFVGDDGVVYRINDLPERISNAGIEERIRNRTGLPSAFTYSFDGHTFYVLYVPGQGTYAYDILGQNWCEFSSDQLAYGWLPRTCVMVGSTVLVGDSQSGKVFKLDSTVSTDDGVIFTRAVSGTVAFSGGRQRHDSTEMWGGFSGPMQVRMRYHDGLDTAFGPYLIAQSSFPQDIVRWTRLGAARQPNRTVEFSTVDPGFWRVSGATANGGRAW